jgi:hypothetical protein
MVILWFRQLRDKFGQHEPVRRMAHVLCYILLVAVGFTIFFKVTERASWQESVWQMWQTATTVGYGNAPAETLGGRIVTILAGTLGIAFVGVAISGAFDVRNYFRERRRLGMAQNAASDGYVLINWPGKENFRVLVEQLRAAEPDVGICVIDDRIDELPGEVEAEFSDLHFVRGSALNRQTWEQAGIRNNKAVIVFPLDRSSADSDGTTKTIISLLSGYCGEEPRLMYVLVDPGNKWMFEGEEATDVWQNLEMLTVVQECHDRFSAAVLARMLSNTEGANPRTVQPHKVTGWTWGEFYDALHATSRRTGVRVAPLALVHEDVGETCPDWDQSIEEGDTLALIAYPGFDWEKFENQMEKP